MRIFNQQPTMRMARVVSLPSPGSGRCLCTSVFSPIGRPSTNKTQYTAVIGTVGSRDHCSTFSHHKRWFSRIYQSPFARPPLPQSSSLFHFHFPPGQQHPDTQDLPAYTDALTERSITHGETRELSLQLGYGLKKYPNLRKGDVVLIFSPNSVDYALAFFGSQAAGLIVTLASASYTPSELAYHMKDSTAQLAFVHPDLVDTYKEAEKIVMKQESSKRIPVYVLDSDNSGTNDSGIALYTSLMAEVSDLDNWEGELIKAGEEHEAAVLCYSSGTTGLPKGVETTHWNLIAMQTIFSEAMEKLTPEDRDKALALLPFSHIFGLALVLLHPLTMRIPIIILPKFTPLTFFNTIQTFKITWSFIVPPLVSLLANYTGLHRYNMTSLRGLLSGAAPMSEQVAQRAMEKLSHHTEKEFMITQGYGLTETSPATHVLRLGEARRKLGSIGQLLPCLEARLVNEKGEDVADGLSGELLLKGPTMMKGYWRNQEATRDSFTEDGWLKTGDVAKVDIEGYWYIVDRLKEMIKVKGLQVAPAELEGLLLAHPLVLDAAVVATRDMDGNELPRAYIVAKDSETAKNPSFPQDVEVWVRSKVSRHKQLRGGVKVVEAIPRSASGKILRKQLFNLEW